MKNNKFLHPFESSLLILFLLCSVHLLGQEKAYSDNEQYLNYLSTQEFIAYDGTEMNNPSYLLFEETFLLVNEIYPLD